MSRDTCEHAGYQALCGSCKAIREAINEVTECNGCAALKKVLEAVLFEDKQMDNLTSYTRDLVLVALGKSTTHSKKVKK